MHQDAEIEPQAAVNGIAGAVRRVVVTAAYAIVHDVGVGKDACGGVEPHAFKFIRQQRCSCLGKRPVADQMHVATPDGPKLRPALKQAGCRGE